MSGLEVIDIARTYRTRGREVKAVDGVSLAVAPGEIVDLRLAIWDSSGHIFDSLVLLDEWRWSLDAAQPGVAPG